jgi:hypothetical protein
MVVSAAAVGALSCYLAFKFSLDASMRLFVITFLIVSERVGAQERMLWGRWEPAVGVLS